MDPSPSSSSSSSSSGEAGSSGRLSVWLGPEEKLVSGLSRRTTAAEVVRAVLEEEAASASRQRGLPRGPSGPWEGYCLVERWRGLERALPAQTRLLRLWGAWGPEERDHVRFLLRRRRQGPPPRSAQARVVPSSSRQRPGGTPSQPGIGSGSSGSQERQRRVVRKAFRKLAKLNRRKEGSSNPAAAAAPEAKKKEAQEEEEEEEESGGGGWACRMEGLVQLVLSQDQTLREQSRRLRELDGQIERYEARLHLERMRRHGVNYVQETYLEDGAGGEEGEQQEEEEEEEGGEDGTLGSFARRLSALSEERSRQEALGESLAAQIQEELNRRWMRRRRQELAASGSAASPTDCETVELLGSRPLPLEEERLRTQLSTSLYIGLRLNTDLRAVREALEDSQRAWREKDRQLQGLLRDLQEEEEEEEEERGPPSGKTEDPEEEEDSDTGLSSMHSQDSDSGPGGPSESLV